MSCSNSDLEEREHEQILSSLDFYDSRYRKASFRFNAKYVRVEADEIVANVDSPVKKDFGA